MGLGHWGCWGTAVRPGLTALLDHLFDDFNHPIKLKDTPYSPPLTFRAPGWTAAAETCSSMQDSGDH